MPLANFLHLSSEEMCAKFDYEQYSSLADREKMKLGFLIVAPAARLLVSVCNDIHPSYWVSGLNVTSASSLVLIKY